jgi:hypothetical protein
MRQNQQTPLHVAASHGHEKVSRQLVELKANINAKDKVSATVGQAGLFESLWMAVRDGVVLKCR